MRLLAAIFAVPLIEIALFVTVVGWLGLWLTLAIVIGTAFAGVLVIRLQGAQAMSEFRSATAQRGVQITPMAGRVLIVMGGMLLILPGFLTDTLGLLLLLPPVRALVIRYLAMRVQVMTAAQGSRQGFGAQTRRSGADVIDGEYFEVTAEPQALDQPKQPPSGWTRH